MVPLSVLDLSPVTSGGTAAAALRNTIDLAQQAELFGYRRYWLAEHHLAPGVASSAPSVLIALVAAATRQIRVGSGAVLLANYAPLLVAEQFGTIAHLHPGRIDLGLGRFGPGRRAREAAAREAAARETAAREAAVREAAAREAAGQEDAAQTASAPEAGAREDAARGAAAPEDAARHGATGDAAAKDATQDASSATGSAAALAPAVVRVVDGLLIPPPARLPLDSPYVGLLTRVLRVAEDAADHYPEQVREILAFLRGGYQAPEVERVHAPVAEQADLEVWVLGSSPGDSARIAGELGLPFAANYHVAPSGVLETVAAYRAAFQPSAALAEPYVLVSADVVVAEDDATAQELASPYGLWVLSIREGHGAIPFPSPQEAARHHWTDEQRAQVADRTATQFVGSPETVAAKLRTLQRATGADELLVTTITHDHADRVRSYQLLAKAWEGSRQ